MQGRERAMKTEEYSEAEHDVYETESTHIAVNIDRQLVSLRVGNSTLEGETGDIDELIYTYRQVSNDGTSDNEIDIQRSSIIPFTHLYCLLIVCSFRAVGCRETYAQSPAGNWTYQSISNHFGWTRTNALPILIGMVPER